MIEHSKFTEKNSFSRMQETITAKGTANSKNAMRIFSEYSVIGVHLVHMAFEDNALNAEERSEKFINKLKELEQEALVLGYYPDEAIDENGTLKTDYSILFEAEYWNVPDRVMEYIISCAIAELGNRGERIYFHVASIPMD